MSISQQKFYKYLTKKLKFLDDNNYTARLIFDYAVKNLKLRHIEVIPPAPLKGQIDLLKAVEKVFPSTIRSSEPADLHRDTVIFHPQDPRNQTRKFFN